MKRTPPPIRYHEVAPRAAEGDVSLDAMIPGDGDLELDIGFGRGLSLFERARAAPESRILGVEIKAKWATKVSARLEKSGLSDRVRVVCEDVRALLSRSGPDGCLARVFVHFPDPWWKKRHRHRLVVVEGLLDELGRLLAPGGELFVQTDVPERAEEYRRTIGEHEAFRLAGADGWLESNPYGAISNRERRAEEDGLPVHRILAHRVGAADLPPRGVACGGGG